MSFYESTIDLHEIRTRNKLFDKIHVDEIESGTLRGVELLLYFMHCIITDFLEARARPQGCQTFEKKENASRERGPEKEMLYAAEFVIQTRNERECPYILWRLFSSIYYALLFQMDTVGEMGGGKGKETNHRSRRFVI